MSGLYIGLMSGTSLDGVDAVIAELGTPQPIVRSHSYRAFPAELRDELLALNQASGHDELRRAALASNKLSHMYAGTVASLLAKSAVDAGTIAAVGCHGQTVRHQPGDGYTIQLINGALLAELTGIAVVCDFRSRDIAAGGQGAPLVPAFHHARFASHSVHRAIVNIGGIANITDLPVSGDVTGFDCGPGNLLMDAWIQHRMQRSYDADGAWAASGRVLNELLDRMFAEPHFARFPPKSTGRDSFNLEWLQQYLAGDESPADVQATLLALTVRGIADAITRFCPAADEIYVCGGGAHNAALMKQMAESLQPRPVATTDALAVSAQHVEALAFAWLAHATMHGLPGNLPSVTGARGARVLGAIYRA